MRAFITTSWLILSLWKLNAQTLQPTGTEALLKVVVINSERQPQHGEVVTFINQTDGTSYKGTTDSSGKFSVLLPKGRKYKVQYEVFSTEQDFKPLDIPVMDDLLTFEYNITVMPPKMYALKNVFFDSGKIMLTKESFKELDKLADYMLRKDTLIIEIAGHTDNIGDSANNLQLSEQRAHVVRDYLLKKGISPDRVIARGYGDTQPVADNATNEGRQQNRRTEVRPVN